MAAMSHSTPWLEDTEDKSLSSSLSLQPKRKQDRTKEDRRKGWKQLEIRGKG